MATCHACGNQYSNPLKVSKDGTTYDFDCFECAIHVLAPVCKHCSCKIIGHGIEDDHNIYCCAHCARKSGVTTAKDHV